MNIHQKLALEGLNRLLVENKSWRMQFQNSCNDEPIEHFMKKCPESGLSLNDVAEGYENRERQINEAIEWVKAQK